MEIDFFKINELFGREILIEYKENIDVVFKNIGYLENLKIESVEKIVEKYPKIFLIEPVTFKEKVDKLIKKLGEEYQEKLKENLEVFESLL